MIDRHELFGDNEAVLDIQNGVLQALEEGYAFVPNAISPFGCEVLAEEADTLSMATEERVAAPLHGGTNQETTQKLERIHLAIGDPRIPMATFVNKSLAQRVIMHRFKPQFEYASFKQWLPTEAGYQLYSDPNHHISKHRDNKNDKMLGATITIAGSAEITVYETLGESNDYVNVRQIDTQVAEPGTVMFLRAAGLGNGERVVHSVSPPIDGPRLILNLRMCDGVLPDPSDPVQIRK